MKEFRICFICLLIVVGCTETFNNEPYTKSKFFMDTYVRISVYDKNIHKNKIDILLDSTFSVMQDLERDLSAHYRGGEIDSVNRFADQKWVTISEPVYDCIQKCLHLGWLSSGKFDITIGVIKRHWFFNPDSAVIPDSLLIEQLLPKVDYRKIDLSHKKIRLKESGMKYTILRHNLYMDFIPLFIGEKVLETGLIYLPAGEGKAAFTLREDMAEVAAHVLTTDGHENQDYDITSPKAYSYQDLATLLYLRSRQNQLSACPQ